MSQKKTAGSQGAEAAERQGAAIASVSDGGSQKSENKDHARRLALSFSFNLVVFVAEIVGAVLTRSLALVVDCAHMLTDLLVLLAAIVTAVLMSRKPTRRRPWGWDRLEIITGGASAAILMCVGVYALIEAIRRLFFVPDTIQDVPLLAGFGVLGLVANLLSLVTLVSRRKDNLNMKAAFLEVCNDALGSVAVLIGSVVILLTGWTGADAVAGAIIAVLIFPRAGKILASSIRVLLIEVPEEIDPEEVRRHLEGVDGVVSVHDLHIAAVRTGVVSITAHVTVRRGLTQDGQQRVLEAMQECVRHHFPVSIEHSTFQLEPEGYTRIERSEGEDIHA